MSQLRHIFKKSHGVEDTPEVRRRAVELTKREGAYRGTDMHGNDWFQELDGDGSQFWVKARGAIIQGPGKNEPPLTWDDDTGFCRNPSKEGAWRGGKGR